MTEDELVERILRLVPAWTDSAFANIGYLDGGFSNSNYAFDVDGARYVIRLPGPEQAFVDRRFEAAWYAQLPETFAKPLVLDVESGTMISAWIDGELLVDAWPRIVEPSRLVEYLETLHSALPPCGRNYDVDALLIEYRVFEPVAPKPGSSRRSPATTT